MTTWQEDGRKLLELLQQVWDLADTFWKWTNKELAEEAGVSEATIYRLRAFGPNDWKNFVIGCHSRTLLRLVKAVELELYLREVPKQKRKVA